MHTPDEPASTYFVLTVCSDAYMNGELIIRASGTHQICILKGKPMLGGISGQALVTSK